jgi:hypothetical protein
LGKPYSTINIYPFSAVPLCKFWVIFQWDDANVHQYKEGGSSYGSIFGVKNGLLISQNGYFWEMILDVSEL